MTASFIQEFEQKYAAYQITPESLPKPNLTVVTKLKKSPIWKIPSAELALHLGDRYSEGNNRYRTFSRYELRGSSGAVLSGGESVLASADLKNPELQPSVRISYDPTSRKLLIVEEHSWSVQRILILNMNGRQEPAHYLRVPSRRSLEPIDHYEIVAFSRGKLYITQDGAAFAFPLDVIRTYSDLDYSIGSTTPINPTQKGVALHTQPATCSNPT
ncbi:hypothetical protein ACFSW8_07690 [Rubritalea tangerina]|uniref:Uncharacterized protein n=1 Tax=Rubritalea tangerina TaxID=430798 RepID=A0ABW4ZA90_9BACT